MAEPTNSERRQTRTLAGLHLGFYTSVTGMGGSEVLVADAMEAAYEAGATITCWSEPGAAIRRIVSSRPQLSITHRDWPLGSTNAVEAKEPGATPGTAPGTAPGRPSSSATAPSARSLLQARVRDIVPASLKRWMGFRRTRQQFVAELRRHRPDILCVNVNGSEAVSAAGQSLGLPVINIYHLSFTRSIGNAAARLGDYLARRQTIRAGTLTIHTSAAVRDQWGDAFGYPSERTRLIYNGVDPVALPERDVTRRALGFLPEQFIFCVPGRLDAMKGHTHLIEAVRLMRDRFTNGLVIVCGDGALRADLERQCKDAGVEPFIRFLGWRQDLPFVLHASDCAVLPSVSSENLSVAILEGLTAGTPAIVSRIGGMAEAIQNDRNGYVVPPANPQALAEAMLRVMTSPDTFRMRASAREDALVRFTRSRMMDEYVSVFAEARDGARSQPHT